MADPFRAFRSHNLPHGPAEIPGPGHARILWRIGDLILEHAEELAQLESLDTGKPYRWHSAPTSRSMDGASGAISRRCKDAASSTGAGRRYLGGR
jgi:acyl-CoA reductase-like NAD-dependent aldehyde dehydrogenase